MWLETITLRTGRASEAAKVVELCRQAFQSSTPEKLLKMTVYSSCKYASDISVYLEWASDPGSESVMSIAICEALRDIGLISHTVWTQEQEFSGTERFTTRFHYRE